MNVVSVALNSRDVQNPKRLQELALNRGNDLTHEDRQAVRKYLEGLTDEQLILSYNTLRDKSEESSASHFYPNIQNLFATPFEREKDRREQKQRMETKDGLSEIVAWYRDAREKSCVWWLENHVIARHALKSCMGCGACTSLCPAAEFYEFSPRVVMTLVQEKDEEGLIELLKSDVIWYCHQCGSCKPKCPRENSPFSLFSSIRQLSQIKGYHIHSVRGRQQYFGRHLWGGNLWNRACTLYFRNPDPQKHRDFGPRFATYFERKEEFMKRIGAQPDMKGPFSGRKVHPETLEELRRLWTVGGAAYFWSLIEEAGAEQAEEMGLTIDEYHDRVMTEG
jgi:heterodisulfide reductase subunit C